MFKLKLITRFYKSFFLADFLVTLACAFILKVYSYEANKIIGFLFWFKLATVVVIFYLAVSYKKNELYYYQNLGLSKMQLALFTSIGDFVLWLALMISVY